MATENKRPSTTHDRPEVDAQRRRFAKGGLAAPVVIGSLLSRPVLGAAPYNCTISGKLSGNVSAHQQGVCSALGTNTASDWIGRWPAWPDQADFFSKDKDRIPLANARDFRNTPKSQIQFEAAYKVLDKTTTPPRWRPATVLEVLLGFVPTYDSDGKFVRTPDRNFTLTELQPGRAPVLLGQESIVTYLNSIEDSPNFPLKKGEVVAMFNSLFHTGSCTVKNGATDWHTADVLEYFKSLHGFDGV